MESEDAETHVARVAELYVGWLGFGLRHVGGGRVRQQ